MWLTVEAKTLATVVARSTSLVWALLEAAAFHSKTWPHPIACRLQSWDASGQTTNRVGTEPHLLTDRLLKVIMSSQPPPDLLLDIAQLTPARQDPALPTGGKLLVFPSRRPAPASGIT